MEKKFNVLVDTHFPYNLDSPRILINRLKLKRGLSHLIPSFILLYYLGFGSKVIMTARRNGKFLGLLYYLKKPVQLRHILYEFIYEPKNTIRGIFSLLIWKMAIKRFDRIFVQSTAEIDYYSKLFKVSKEKFIYIPVAIPERGGIIGPTPDGYLFSAGRTQRDFPILLKVLSSLNIPAVIVASKNEKTIFKKAPPSVRIYFDIPKEDYLRLLAGAYLVVITLKEGIPSRGQVVLLEAMALGKPVICTDVPSIRDYLLDGVNGFLVPPGDAEALKSKIIHLYNNPQTLKKVGLKAYRIAVALFNTKRFEANFLKALSNVCST